MLNTLDQHRPAKVTAFLAMRGDKYCGELIVYGRAVNGWDVPGYDSGANIISLAEVDEALGFADAVFASVSNETACPMGWVTDPSPQYNPRRSAFWRCTKRVLHGLGIDDEDEWYSHLTWSNLYKVAPAKGNPGVKLKRAQRRDASSYLHTRSQPTRPSAFFSLRARTGPRS